MKSRETTGHAFTAGEPPWQVTGHFLRCGADVAAVITGGTRPHIGAAALAEARPSLSGDGSLSASASVLCRAGHKDDLWAREAALSLAAAANAAALVTVGIHVDAADSEAIARLRENFEAVLAQMKSALTN